VSEQQRVGFGGFTYGVWQVLTKLNVCMLDFMEQINVVIKVLIDENILLQASLIVYNPNKSSCCN
jgi:hypothetical protein